MPADVHSQVMDSGTQTHNRRRVNAGATALLLLYIAFVLFYHLPYNPRPHFDEGNFMKIAKSHALYGVYADYSNEGYRYGTGGVVSTGPTLILPIALLYSLFGPSLWLGRLVAAIYTCLLLLALYALGVRLLDRRLGLAIVLLTIVHPGLEVHNLGRLAMGEFPGLFFLVAALWLWLSPRKSALTGLAGAGLLFGLACITKNQYAVSILPALFLSWILDIFWYRKRGWAYFVVPGAIAGFIYFAWTFYVLFLLGAEARDVWQDLEYLRSLTAHYFALDGLNINNNIDLLVSDPLFIPALIYGAVLALRRTDEDQVWGTILILVLSASVMFILSNVWWLYSVPARGLSIILIAHMLHRLTNGYRLNWQELRHTLRGSRPSLAVLASLMVIGLLLGMFTRPLYMQIKTLLTRSGDDVYRVVQFIQETIPQDRLIATWESELGVLTNHTYHFMLRSLIVSGSLIESGRSIREWLEADYAIIGRFAKDDKLFRPENLSGFELIHTVGVYDIYLWKGE